MAGSAGLTTKFERLLTVADNTGFDFRMKFARDLKESRKQAAPLGSIELMQLGIKSKEQHMKCECSSDVC